MAISASTAAGCATSGGSGDSYGASSADNGVTTTDDCVMDKGMCRGIGFRSVTIPLDGRTVSATSGASSPFDGLLDDDPAEAVEGQ